MRAIVLTTLIAGLMYVNSDNASCQPLRLDATVSGWYSLNLLKVDGGIEGYTYGGGGNGLGVKATYLIQQWDISPVLRFQFYFPLFAFPKALEVNAHVLKLSGYLVNAGIEKSFTLGYSTLDFSLGIGYYWENNSVEERFVPTVSFALRDPIYVVGASLHLPFLSTVDAVLDYTLLLREESTIEREVFKTIYTLEAGNLYHVFSVGVSFKFLEQSENN